MTNLVYVADGGLEICKQGAEGNDEDCEHPGHRCLYLTHYSFLLPVCDVSLDDFLIFLGGFGVLRTCKMR